jgi:hypothetical protein
MSVILVSLMHVSIQGGFNISLHFLHPEYQVGMRKKDKPDFQEMKIDFFNIDIKKVFSR